MKQYKVGIVGRDRKGKPAEKTDFFHFVRRYKELKFFVAVLDRHNIRLHKNGAVSVDGEAVLFEAFIRRLLHFVPARRHDSLFPLFHADDLGNGYAVYVLKIGDAEHSVFEKDLRFDEYIIGEQRSADLRFSVFFLIHKSQNIRRQRLGGQTEFLCRVFIGGHRLFEKGVRLGLRLFLPPLLAKEQTERRYAAYSPCDEEPGRVMPGRLGTRA